MEKTSNGKVKLEDWLKNRGNQNRIKIYFERGFNHVSNNGNSLLMYYFERVKTIDPEIVEFLL